MKIRNLLIAALAMAGMTACNNDNDNDVNPVVKGEPTEVTLSVRWSATKALNGQEENGIGDENKIESTAFFVFDSTGAIDTEVGGGQGYVVFPNSETTQTVIMSSGNDMKIVTVVNIDASVLAASLGSTNQYENLKAALSTGEFTAGASGSNARTIPANGLEMSGETKANIVADVTTNFVTINVSRLVSKINAPYFENTAGTPTTIELEADEIEELWPGESINANDLTFTGLGYTVINGITKSSVLFVGNASGDDSAPETVKWNTWSWTGKAYLNSTFDGNGLYTSAYSGKPTAIDWFLDASVDGEKHVYAYENKPDTKNDAAGQEGYNSDNVYAFIIKGKISVDGAPDKDLIRYWRVDIVRDNDYHVLRNCSYHVYVSKVTSAGLGTPKEAEKGGTIIPGKDKTSAQVQVIVNPWRVNLYQTEM